MTTYEPSYEIIGNIDKVSDRELFNIYKKFKHVESLIKQLETDLTENDINLYEFPDRVNAVLDGFREVNLALGMSNLYSEPIKDIFSRVKEMQAAFGQLSGLIQYNLNVAERGTRMFSQNLATLMSSRGLTE